MTISQIVEKKFKRTKDKSLLFASDFPEYDQDYIGDLLSIYVREGKLVRLANGVYLKTTVTKFGPVFPSPTEIAEAIARRDHAQVLMRGVPKNFAFKDKTMATLCLALKSIGNGHVTDEQKSVLRNFLNDYIQEHDIKSDLKLMPQWIQKMLNEIIYKES